MKIMEKKQIEKLFNKTTYFELLLSLFLVHICHLISISFLVQNDDDFMEFMRKKLHEIKKKCKKSKEK